MEPLAVYAAIVATASVGWQIYSWWHRRRSHVAVEIRYAVASPPEGDLPVVTIGAINHSEHPVRVTGLGLDFQDRHDEQFHQWRPLDIATIPGIVEPHDSGEGFARIGDVESAGIDVYEPVTAWVRLSTGEVLRSASTRLRSRN